jgi:hypothetical protein
MGNYEVLARRFADANLRAEVIERPVQAASLRTPGARAVDVVQMAILGKGRDEWFRIWPGARTNRVEAEGIDRELRQLVLLVHEPVRTFAEQISKRRAVIDRDKVKVVAESLYFVWIERRTDARKRHFLCGRDERQLFICQLPRAVTTVRDAHEVLRAPVVTLPKDKVVRQGEWFFLEPSVKDLAALATALRELRTIIRTRVSIGGGHPHVADEYVVVPVKRRGKEAVERIVLVRGRVRHVDHDTVYLPSWAKVVRNAEPVADDGVARMDGIRWID